MSFSLPLDGFAASQDPLPGPMDQFEEQTTPQQPFESAGLSQGWCEFSESADQLTWAVFSLQTLDCFSEGSCKILWFSPSNFMHLWFLYNIL